MQSPHSQLDAQSVQPAFTLVELAIVITIIGIVAAIAVPHVADAGDGASGTGFRSTIQSVRRAIDLYAAEHGRFPGTNPTTGAPDGDSFVDQMLLYSDERGYTNEEATARYLFGPYLRAPFPTNPINDLDTVRVKRKPSDLIAENSSGWIAVLGNGDFHANNTAEDLEAISINAVEAHLIIGKDGV